MTSTSAFDRFTFSAENTDEEQDFSGEENLEIDTSQRLRRCRRATRQRPAAPRVGPPTQLRE